MSLTLLHTSDWHLGHELNGEPREAEHDLFLDWLHDTLGAQDVDVLVVTGDIYDVANPPVSAMRRLFGFLQRACASYRALQVVILGGNHDSAMRIDLPAALLGAGQVHFVGALPRRDGAPDFARMLIPLHDRAGDLRAWLAAVPFCRPADLGRESLATLYAGVQEAGLAKAQGLPLVVTGHLHVAGGSVSEMSERRIVIGGEEAEAASLFDARTAYVALGHLHRPQDISGATRIRYAGSPFPLSATERNYRHSVSLVRLGADTHAPCEVDTLPIPRPAAFLAIGPSPLEDAVAEIAALDTETDLPRTLWPFIDIKVSVTGPEPGLAPRILDALDGKALRLVSLKRVHARAQDAATARAPAADLDELRPEEVFAQLYTRQYPGDGPPEDLARAFAQLLVETQADGEDA